MITLFYSLSTTGAQFNSRSADMSSENGGIWKLSSKSLAGAFRNQSTRSATVSTVELCFLANK